MRVGMLCGDAMRCTIVGLLAVVILFVVADMQQKKQTVYCSYAYLGF